MRFSTPLSYLILLLFALSCAGPAVAEKRVALVVGNSAYQHAGRLTNSRNDATDIAGALKKLGFHVIEGFDLDKVSFDRMIREFATTLQGASAGLFFFAGHGLQVAGHNYLVPVDARLTTASALEFEMIRIDTVQRIMEHEASTNILFLDACRDNPLARNLARAMGTRSAEVGLGLAPVVSGVGTLVSFSTQPGNVALDGTGRNSPFAGALVKYLRSSSDDLSAILISVRNDVIKETQNKQVPWEHSALRGRFYFNPGRSAPVAAWRLSEAAEAWDRTKDSTNLAALELFTARYKDTYYAGLAQLRLEELKKQRISIAIPSTQSKPAEKRDAAIGENKQAAQSQSDAAEGDRYYWGRGVARDYVKARQAYQKAAVAGHAGSMNALGRIYQHGLGVPRNYANARDWYDKAAARGEASAITNLARLHREGWGVPQDYAKARDLFERAFAAGHADGAAGVGWLYQNGWGVPQDFARAREHYERAIAKGNPTGMNNLGTLHEQGLGVSKDYGKAREWFEKAAAGGNDFGMNNMGRLYEFGWGVPQNFEKSREWYERAVAIGNGLAKGNLARLLDKGKGGRSDFARAANLLLESAFSGNGGVIEMLQGDMQTWTRATRIEVKRRLAHLGYYRGLLNDTWDGRTHVAIGKFLAQ